MALTTRQKEALTEFTKTQPALKPRGQLGAGEEDIDLGTMLANGKVLDNDHRDVIVELPFTLPAPAGAAATVDLLAWKAPYAGRIVSAELIVNGTWSGGNNVGDKYLVAVRRHNNTAANLTKDHDLVTGLAAFTSARLPTGSSLAMLTSGDDITITVDGATMTLVHESNFVNLPGVGDYVSITSVATVAAGATPANPGVYQVTAVNSAKSITMTKLFGANPEAVAVAACGAGDVSDVRLIPATEATFSSGDMLGLRAIVPINTTTPVDVSALKMTLILRVRAD
jgi:hypothetical protein